MAAKSSEYDAVRTPTSYVADLVEGPGRLGSTSTMASRSLFGPCVWRASMTSVRVTVKSFAPGDPAFDFEV